MDRRKTNFNMLSAQTKMSARGPEFLAKASKFCSKTSLHVKFPVLFFSLVCLFVLCACAPQVSDSESDANTRETISFSIYDQEGRNQTFSLYLDELSNQGAEKSQINDSIKEDQENKDTTEKPAILHFWGAFCPICVYELPQWEDFYQQYKAKVDFYMIDLADYEEGERDAAIKLCRDEGYSFSLYFDEKLAAATALSLEKLPYTILLDESGQVRTVCSGKTELEELREQLD